MRRLRVSTGETATKMRLIPRHVWVWVFALTMSMTTRHLGAGTLVVGVAAAPVPTEKAFPSAVADDDAGRVPHAVPAAVSRCAATTTAMTHDDDDDGAGTCDTAASDGVASAEHFSNHGGEQQHDDARSVPPLLVAMADIHGDYHAALESLQLAGIVDALGHWSGGNARLVQTGDLVDRGPGEHGTRVVFFIFAHSSFFSPFPRTRRFHRGA